MDPKANLEEQLRIAHEIEAWDDAEDDGGLTASEQVAYLSGRAGLLAELVLALDEWQRKGGFSPYAKAGAAS